MLGRNQPGDPDMKVLVHISVCALPNFIRLYHALLAFRLPSPSAASSPVVAEEPQGRSARPDQVGLRGRGLHLRGEARRRDGPEVSV